MCFFPRSRWCGGWTRYRWWARRWLACWPVGGCGRWRASSVCRTRRCGNGGVVTGPAALAVALGGPAPELCGEPERAGLEALGAAWWQARRRFGESVAGVFDFASLVSGGELLATTTSPPWASLGATALMPPVPDQT